MAYSHFKLSQVKEKYGLLEKKEDLFPNLVALEPTSWLRETLEMAVQMPLNSEKAKSEFIISPILLEAWKLCDKSFTIFSGATLDVENGLTGECDFILSGSAQSQEIEAPIFTLIEAKDDNLRSGYGQCLAQMYAAQLFNEKKGHPTPTIYGCVTTGEDWQFLKLFDKTVHFDDGRFYLSNVDKILGVLKTIVQYYIK
jgi:hypothetical protein